VEPGISPTAALIARDKVVGYLLSRAHPVGRYKAAFFMAMGYAPEAPEVFERDIAQLLKMTPHGPIETEFGRKFSTRGVLVGPNGRRARVVAVWIMSRGEQRPRLVTVYPEG
jgi:hypothetical protein